MTTVYKHIHTGECVIEDDAFDYAVKKLKNDKCELGDFLGWYFDAEFNTFRVEDEHIEDFIAYGEDYERVLNEKRISSIEDY